MTVWDPKTGTYPGTKRVYEWTLASIHHSIYCISPIDHPGSTLYEARLLTQQEQADVGHLVRRPHPRHRCDLDGSCEVHLPLGCRGGSDERCIDYSGTDSVDADEVGGVVDCVTSGQADDRGFRGAIDRCERSEHCGTHGD